MNCRCCVNALLEPAEQIVDHGRELSDLVVRIADRQTLAETGGADALRALSHRYHRGEAAPREQPAADGRQEERERNGDQEPEPGIIEDFLFIVKRDCRADPEASIVQRYSLSSGAIAALGIGQGDDIGVARVSMRRSSLPSLAGSRRGSGSSPASLCGRGGCDETTVPAESNDDECNAAKSQLTQHLGSCRGSGGLVRTLGDQLGLEIVIPHRGSRCQSGRGSSGR